MADIRKENPGLPEEVIAALEEEQQHLFQTRRCKVYRDNLPALELFTAIRAAGLFRYGGMGGLIGIDWQQVHYCPFIKPPDNKEIWLKVNDIAIAFCTKINE